MRFNHGIIDNHVHAHGGCGVDAFLRNASDHLSASGLDAENLLCVKHASSACITEAEALLAKAVYHGKFTVYGNPTFLIDGFDTTPDGVGQQVREFYEAGIDGVKLGDGNGGIGVPLDSPIFDPMYTALEETGMPMLYHVGHDAYIPARRVFQKNRYPVANPPFLIYKEGVDDDQPEGMRTAPPGIPMITNEEKWAQMENILSRHPKVNLTFAHTYFMSDNLDRLAQVFDRHENVKIDLTPCYQIYYYFSKNPKKVRDFMGTYRDRILFGTDNEMELDPITVINLIRQALETDETFFSVRWGFDVQGLGLPKDVLEDIYKNNFLRIQTGKPFSPRKAASFCEHLYETVRIFEDLPEANKEEVAECARRLAKMS